MRNKFLQLSVISVFIIAIAFIAPPDLEAADVGVCWLEKADDVWVSINPKYVEKYKPIVGKDKVWVVNNPKGAKTITPDDVNAYKLVRPDDLPIPFVTPLDLNHPKDVQLYDVIWIVFAGKLEPDFIEVELVSPDDLPNVAIQGLFSELWIMRRAIPVGLVTPDD